MPQRNVERNIRSRVAGYHFYRKELNRLQGGLATRTRMRANDLFTGEAGSRCGWNRIWERALNLDVAFSLAVRAISWFFRYTRTCRVYMILGKAHSYMHMYISDPSWILRKCNNGGSQGHTRRRWWTWTLKFNVHRRYSRCYRLCSIEKVRLSFVLSFSLDLNVSQVCLNKFSKASTDKFNE